MDYFVPQSGRLSQIIAEGRGVSDKSGWVALKSAGVAWKPADYDAYQIDLRHYYEGRISEHLRRFAKLRFEMTGDRMPLVPLNWARLYAENGAAVHDYPAQWFLTRDGQRLDAEPDEGADQKPEDTQRAADFAEMVDEAALDVLLAEAERRCVLARTIFLRVHSDSVEAAATGEPPITRVTVFWPDGVLVVPHHRCPASLSTAVALMARVAGEDGVQSSSCTWEVWTRSYSEDEYGVPSFGPWSMERITETKRSARDVAGNPTTETDVAIKKITWRTPDGKVSEAYPLPTLPWVVWHHGLAEGCPFLDVDRNLVEEFDTVNATLMSEQFAVDMCAAPILWRQTDDVAAPSKIALGPGVMATVRKGDTVNSTTQTTDFAGIRGAAQALVGLVAITHRQNPRGFSSDKSGNPPSGVALAIENLPQMKARLEAINRAVAVEEQLLAVMVEVHDFFRGTSIADDGIEYVVQPTDPPDVEDPAAKLKRWIDARDAGLASDEEARMGAGMSRTIDEARAALEKIREEKQARPSALGDKLLALAQAPPPGQPTDPAPTDEPKKPAVPDTGGAAVADTALNGAQVSSLLEVVQAVAQGILPKATAQALIAAAFPGIGPPEVKAIVGPVDEGSAKPADPP